jgi:putative glutamine amidotransferase
MHKPVVLIPSCTHTKGAHRYFAAQIKYVAAVAEGAGCAPLLLPALGAATDWEAVLRLADGILLTGAASNVEPGHFGETVHNPRLPLDPQRDATTLPLIAMARQRGLPLLAICRGFQEVNVALGGSLHQAVHEQPDLMDHRENGSEPLELQYAARHAVTLAENGRLAAILGSQAPLHVNSLHGQGIARLAAGLRVEARAPDGLVEAYSLDDGDDRTDAEQFFLGVQWHPEWQFKDNPEALKLLAAFGQACRHFRQNQH